ncbi:MAG: ABC transporter ATP-binding protein [Cytophagales bacterium]|nr:ABC transporter ATP-binding protein [Cytophagales bacterium]
MGKINVKAEGLEKNYGKVQAVRSVSFEVEEGELFGLIGPDGAGKTSIFRMLASLILPDSGTVRVAGFDPVKQYQDVRRRIGYMPGRFSLYQDLSVEENVQFFASVFGTSLSENYELVADIYRQIEPFRDRKAGALSGGMKQKLALCCALIHKPEVLLLDEPTTGVDPVSRKEFWQMLKRLKTKGISVVVSTPYMDEAGLCDRIALIQKGKILRIDAPERISESFPFGLWLLRAREMFALLTSLRKYPHAQSAYSFGEDIHFVFQKGKENPEALKEYLQGLAFKDLEIREGKPTIEDCFMAMDS